MGTIVNLFKNGKPMEEKKKLYDKGLVMGRVKNIKRGDLVSYKGKDNPQVGDSAPITATGAREFLKARREPDWVRLMRNDRRWAIMQDPMTLSYHVSYEGYDSIRVPKEMSSPSAVDLLMNYAKAIDDRRTVEVEKKTITGRWELKGV